MASPTSKLIWENGIPLSSAWDYFCSESDRKLYSELPNPIETAKSFKPDDELGVGMALFKGAMALHEAHSKKNAVRDHLRANLLDDIINAKFIATGFREAPTTSQSPVEINSDDFLDGYIEWDLSELRVHGKIYGRVRVISPTQLEKFKIVKPRKGLSGNEAELRNAIQTLINESDDFCKIKRKDAFKRIRNYLIIKNVNSDYGLSDQNLGKYIIEFCPKKRHIK